MRNVLLAVLSPLFLAACNLSGDASLAITVSASALKVDPSLTGTTTYTFTNKAGHREVSIDSVLLKWNDPITHTEHTETVNVNLKLPAGLTCPAALTNPSFACDYHAANTFPGNRTLSYPIADDIIFGKVIAANSNPADIHVSVQFDNEANALDFHLSNTSSTLESRAFSPVAPVPVLTLNTSGDQPYNGSLSITVAGNFNPKSTVDRLILEITDAAGQIDNTTYINTSSTFTFNIDTSRFPDGNLTLKAIALTKEGLHGETAARTVQVRNIFAPLLSILSPEADTTITEPITARVQLRQGNTPYTLRPLDSSGNDIRLDVRDFRGQSVQTLYGKALQTSQGVFEAFLSLDLIGPAFSSNNYTLEASVQATLADQSSSSVRTTLPISTRVNDRRPPALSIIMPAYITDPYSQAFARSILNRHSALMIQTSSDRQLSGIRVDFVCDPATAAAGQECPLAPYSYNIPIDASGIFVRVFEIGSLLDAQPYVQNGNYTLRVIAYNEANANIQEFPVRISRTHSDSVIDGLEPVITLNLPTVTNPGELKPSSAIWQINGTTTHPVRVATLAYDNSTQKLIPSRSRIDPELPSGTAISTTQVFSKEGDYRIDYIVQDLVTGVTRYYQGQVVVVKSNSKSQS